MSSSHALAGLSPGRAPPIRLSLFGQLTLMRGETTLQLPYARAYGLLLILSLSVTPPSRHELVHMLWPGTPEQEARARLRHALFVLDRLLRPARVERLHHQLQLPHHAMRCDVWEAMHLCERIETADPRTLRAAHAEALTGLWRMPIAGAFSIADAPAFEQWLSSQRDFWSRRLRHASQRVATELTTRGHTPEGVKAVAQTPGRAPVERYWLACIMALAREPNSEATHHARALTALGEALLKDSSAVLMKPHPGTLLVVFGLLPDRTEPDILARTWAEQMAASYRAAHIPAAIGVHAGWHLSAWPQDPFDPTGTMTRHTFEVAAVAATGTVYNARPKDTPPRHDGTGEYTRLLDGLAPTIRRAAGCLAVYRDSFSRQDVLSACRTVTRDPSSVVSTLIDVGLLVTAGRGRWRFATSMLRYLAGQRLPRPHALRLHRSVAQRYSNQHHPREAALHFLEGRQFTQAAMAWCAAGEAELHAGSVLYAHYCYRRAAHVMATSERSSAELRLQIPLGLAAATRMIRGARDEHHGGPAVQLLSQLKLSGAASISMQVRHMLWTLRIQARGPLAARTLGTHLMRNANVAPWRAVAHACRAAESLLRGRYRQCLSAVAEAEKWVRLTADGAAAPTPGIDMVAIARAMHVWASGMNASAYEPQPSPSETVPAHTAGLVWYCHAVSAQYRGDKEETQRCAAQLAACATQTGLSGLALLARVLGHHTTPQTIERQLADALEAVRLTSTLALSQVPMIAGIAGELCLRARALGPLQSCIRRGLHAARRTNVRLGLTRLLWLQAKLCELRGEPERAAQWLERSRRTARFLREIPYPPEPDAPRVTHFS